MGNTVPEAVSRSDEHEGHLAFADYGSLLKRLSVELAGMSGSICAQSGKVVMNTNPTLGCFNEVDSSSMSLIHQLLTKLLLLLRRFLKHIHDCLELC